VHLLYCDESNLRPRENAFFIYGGIAMDGESARQLHEAIRNLREEKHIDPSFHLKFNPRPENLSHEEFAALKQCVIEAAVKEHCALLVTVILHDIASSPDEARRNEINRAVYHFNCLVSRRNDYGMVLVDRFSDSQIDAHLREKFSIGVRGLPYTDPLRLDRIMGYHYSAIGQPHFGSVVDIVLGSFRYAVNAHALADSPRLATASRLLAMISPLFLRNQHTEMVEQISLFFSPRTVRIDSYRRRYAGLKRFLSQHGIVAEQEIPGSDIQ
jgi:hypothetical protein